MRCFITYLLFCMMVLVFAASQAQDAKINDIHIPIIDSLIGVLKVTHEDTSQVNILNEISIQYIYMDRYEQALPYAQRAKNQAEKIKYKQGMGCSYNNIGNIYWYQGNYEQALNNYQKSLIVRKEIGDNKGISVSYNNIGNIYDKQGNYEKSIENYLKSLKIREDTGDKKGIASSYNNIGNIYRNQGNYESALNNYLKSLKMKEQISLEYPNDMVNNKGIGNSYNNIGLVYMNQGDYEKSLDNYWKGLKIREEIRDRHGIASSYNNIGNVYIVQENYKEALDNHLKSLKIMEEIGDTHGMAMSYANIGNIFLKDNNPRESYYYLNKSLILFENSGNKSGMRDAYTLLSDLFDKNGDYKKAYNYHKLYSDIKDTILNEQSGKQIAEMNTKYDSEKKDKELLKKDLEISKQLVETEKKHLQRNVFIICFALVLALSFFIFRVYSNKRNANILLEIKNTLIENQKQLVEEKSGKIMDSIIYAKRIQQAILPSRDLIKSLIPDSFVFFKPKDIVSGDFYWIHAIDEDQVMLAVVDCTGHGVPGALMSMMGFNLLEQIVKERQIYEPGIILDELSKLVMDSLKQTNELSSVKEGMDIALLKINNRTMELEFAGAHNSLYLVRNEKLSELKADRKSIGGALSHAVPFSNFKIKVQKGDCLYAFSDGYADQFGGPDNEKFYYHPFRELLTGISQQSMEEQEGKLEKVISEWKGHKAQIDDMLVIGVRV